MIKHKFFSLENWHLLGMFWGFSECYLFFLKLFWGFSECYLFFFTLHCSENNIDKKKKKNKKKEWKWILAYKCLTTAKISMTVSCICRTEILYTCSHPAAIICTTVILPCVESWRMPSVAYMHIQNEAFWHSAPLSITTT